jgi:sodium transport system permease protein
MSPTSARRDQGPSSGRPGHVLATLGKELRETLRDRRTVAMMVLFPLVVYPLLSLLVSQLVITREQKRESQPRTVAVQDAVGGLQGAAGLDAPGGLDAAADLRRRISETPRALTLRPAGTPADVEAGRLDALLIMGGSAKSGRAVEIVYDAAREESREAGDRLTDLLAGALPEGCVRFDIKKRDLASGTKLGGYLLSKALPLALVLMVLLGAFYPAIDVTAGERERGTLETVLTAPIARFDLLLGKVLAVTVIAGLTGLFNLGSMAVTLIHAIRLADPHAALPIPWSRAAAGALVLAPAAFLFGALFVAIGSMARGFKEAQSLLMPAYFVSIAPALIGGVGDYQLGGLAALVPAMNITLLARELLLGTARVGPALLALGSTVAYGCLALAFAARIYDSERFVDPRAGGKASGGDGPPDGKNWLPPEQPPGAGEALVLFTVAFALLWFVFVPWQKRDLVSGLLATQWLGMLGLVALLARITRRPLTAMIALRRPSRRALWGAVIIGASAWGAVAMLSEWLVPVPREVIEQLRRALMPENQSRGLAVNLLLVAVTPAVCEEALFRGVVLRGLATRMAPSAAVAVTGVLFGMFHLDLWRLFPSTVLGILLSWVALESGSLVPSMVIHFLNNAILVTLASLGIERRLGALGRGAGATLFLVCLVLVAAGVLLVRRDKGQEGPGR